MIQDKFELLKQINDPKIIIVSGSSSAFGIDQKEIENVT